MPTICMLADHPDADGADVKALQAIISNWFDKRYGSPPEFLDVLDYFDVKGGSDDSGGENA